MAGGKMAHATKLSEKTKNPNNNMLRHRQSIRAARKERKIQVSFENNVLMFKVEFP